MKKYRIGMFGGSFDPLHKGHLHVIRKAAEICENPYIVLSHSRKRDRIPFELRYRWLRDTLEDMGIGANVITLEDASENKESSWDEWEKGRDHVVERIGSNVDVVFAGSDYKGSNIYERLYRCPVIYVDRSETANISSTAIEKFPLGEGWEAMAPKFRGWYRKRILIAGVESTGKTTMTGLLAKHYGSDYQLEYGRDVCETCYGETLMVPSDYIKILHNHAALEWKKIENSTGKFFFTDTDAITTLRFARQARFSAKDMDTVEALAWATARANRYDLVLFLEPTVPFVQDGSRIEYSERERQSNSDRLKRMYIDGYGGRCPLVSISGKSYEERIQMAIGHIDRFLTPNSRLPIPNSQFLTTFPRMKICPHCGAEIPDKAPSCKACGSDAETGWAKGAEHADLELPDYEEILENEFGTTRRKASRILSAIVGGILAFVLLLVFSGIV